MKLLQEVKLHFTYNSEEYTIAGIVFSCVAALIAIILTIVNWQTSYQCSNYAELTGIKTEYIFLDTCYIEHKGRMYRWDEYKAIHRQVEISQ